MTDAANSAVGYSASMRICASCSITQHAMSVRARVHGTASGAAQILGSRYDAMSDSWANSVWNTGVRLTSTGSFSERTISSNGTSACLSAAVLFALTSSISALNDASDSGLTCKATVLMYGPRAASAPIP